MNDVLAQMEWGYVDLGFDPNGRSLVLNHSAPPSVATAADPAGGWIGAVLEGLYAAWMAAQPGADTNLVARRTAVLPGQVSLRYGRD